MTSPALHRPDTSRDDDTDRPGEHRCTVVVRPLATGDTRTVRAVFEGLGERSRWQRFLTPTPRLSTAALEALAAVDGRRHVAIVAHARAPGGAPVGIARYHLSSPGRAEVTLAVVDHCQRRGVGSTLVRALAHHARLRGVTTLHGTALADNRGVLRILARELTDLRTVHASGLVDFEGRPAGNLRA